MEEKHLRLPPKHLSTIQDEIDQYKFTKLNDYGRNAYIQATGLEVSQERIAIQKLQELVFVLVPGRELVVVVVPRRFIDVELRGPRSKVVHDGVEEAIVLRFWSIK